MGFRERIQRQILRDLPQDGLLPSRRPFLLTSNGSVTLTPEDSGKVVITNRNTSTIVTLPPTQEGLIYTLINNQVTSAGGHAFSPHADDKIQGNGLSKADDADLVNSAATDVVGDSVTLIGDGTDGWWVLDIKGTWA